MQSPTIPLRIGSRVRAPTVFLREKSR